jgi:hypothetical protein
VTSEAKLKITLCNAWLPNIMLPRGDLGELGASPGPRASTRVKESIFNTKDTKSTKTPSFTGGSCRGVLVSLVSLV